jgi:hypothetical protein
MLHCHCFQEVVMKKATIFHLVLGLLIIPLAASCLVLTPRLAMAQYQYAPYSEASENFSREELAQLLAPIALYPDPLLSQILMASTYPIEVIEADRWVSRNPQLKGDALDWALVERDWDPSVKALCHFPSILALMSERIAETTDLGNAFLAQEAEVMAMVQDLRATAYAQGNLTTNAQQTVIVERETIIIEPANPRVIYVPYYDPYYVYGSWWYPAYPPYFWGPPGVSVVGISYWPGMYFSFSFGNWSTFDWHRHAIFIDVHKRPKFVRHDRWVAKPGSWKHAPAHRRGVVYRDAATASKYGQPFKRTIDSRGDTRNSSEQGNLTRERDRRVENRPQTDRDRRVDNRSRVEHNRQGQQQLERERQLRERSERERQEQAKLERTRQERERVERQQAVRDQQKRQLVEREKQARESAERERQLRGRVEREQQERTKVDRERQGRERAERELQVRQRTEQERLVRERAERGQQQRVHDNNVKRGDAGKKEHVSAGESGQDRRQASDHDARDRGRSGGDSRSGRDDRGDNRR